VLLADSSLDFGTRLQNQLRSAGLNVRIETAASRAALEEYIGRRDSDLVLVDWESTIISAREVVGMVADARIDLPVVAMAVSIDAAMVLESSQARVAALMLREEPAHAEDVIRREYARRCQRLAMAGAAARIQELERRCDAMLESSRDAIAYVHDGMHVRANPSYLELFGVSGFEELEGTTLLDMIEPSTAGRFKEVLKRLAKGDAPKDPVSITAQRVDGSTFDADILFANASFEGEPCVQITLRRREVLVASDLDPLTGLANRQSVFRHCQDLVAGLTGGVSDTALALLEPDGFDRVAEAVGIAQADELVRKVAEGIREFALAADLVARYSDHGFVLLMRGCGHDEAVSRIESLRGAFADHVFESGNRSFPITISTGLVLVSDAIASSDDLLGRAGRALKAAQDSGGNRVEIDDPAAKEKADTAADEALLGRIRRAVEDKGLVLAFEPVVSLQGEEGEHSQVLVRLASDAGEMTPGQFFPLAERYGLLAAIDRRVVALACAQLAERFSRGHHTTLFVKLSPHSLDDPDFAGWIVEQLRKHGVEGTALVFEIPEGTVATNLNGVRQFRQALAPSGCRLAVQDFGAAANAQQIAQHVAADFMKLDRRLMPDLPKSGEKQSRLRELCAVAHSMGGMTIAQFVEDSASMAVLFTLGVDFVQGNFLSEPEQIIGAG
jgi:diguanylate cyclase (GGDEF)-like protein/PAS domain S-box-containing protein